MALGFSCNYPSTEGIRHQSLGLDNELPRGIMNRGRSLLAATVCAALFTSFVLLHRVESNEKKNRISNQCELEK